MNHTPSSIGIDLMTFGAEAIGVHHSTYTRLLRAEHQAVLNNVRGTNRGTGLRALLGNAMISLGTIIAGKKAHMQERQATRPSASSRSGFAPTR